LSSSINILLLEDDPSSVRLFARKLQSAPEEINYKSVRNKETFIRELETSNFDCIVLDFTLPDINGLEALRLVKELAPGTPSIIYTGSVGEEKAAECIKEGAAEFLLKTNSVRLVPAILSIVTQKREHEARIRAEQAQEQSEALFHTLAETSTAAIFIFHGDKLSYVNSVSERLTGYTNDELLHMNGLDLVHPDHREIMRQRGLARQRGEEVPARYEFKIITKNGQVRWMDFAANSIFYEGVPAALGIAFDVTDRKRIEEDRRASELNFRTLVEQSLTGVYAIQSDKFVYANHSFTEIFGYSREELLNDVPFMEIVAESDRALVAENLRKHFSGEEREIHYSFQGKRKDGVIINIEVQNYLIEWNERPAVIGTVLNINDRTRAERTINQSEEKY
jgi:PAS domain S-box-containing protein